MYDTQFVEGARSYNQDPMWQEEMERKRRARMWMEQRMMEEEMRRRRQRAEFGHGFNFGETHRDHPEREEALRQFFRNFFLRMLGAFIVLECFFSAMVPSGCSQYAQGCSCQKCMSQENYMKKLSGSNYNRMGHPGGCECQLCIRVYRNIKHSSDCRCTFCQMPG